jgi:double zinc ribbon protein
VTCPSCGHENPAGARFCNGCGATLEGACPRCGKPNPAGSRFCNGCGGSLQAAAIAERVKSPSASSFSPAVKYSVSGVAPTGVNPLGPLNVSDHNPSLTSGLPSGPETAPSQWRRWGPADVVHRRPAVGITIQS